MYRREALKFAATAMATAGTLPAAAGAQQAAAPSRARVADDGPSPAWAATYRRAVDAMLKLPPTDGRNWYRQALVHLMDCPHGNWWFLPWHRAYLGHFEGICRELTGDDAFRLPYWDWTAIPRLPAAFLAPGLDPSTAPFEGNAAAWRAKFRPAVAAMYAAMNDRQKRVAQLRGYTTADRFLDRAVAVLLTGQDARGLKAGSTELDDMAKFEVAPERIDGILTETTWQPFGSFPTSNHIAGGAQGLGLLETGPHNNVHGGVSGVMGDFMSPVDPVFWAHHANVDRIWVVWSAAQEAAGRAWRPLDAAWEREVFPFFVDRKGQPAEVTAKQAAENPLFRTSYEPGAGSDTPAIPAALLSAVPVAARTFASTSAPARATEALAAAASVSIPAQFAAVASWAIRSPNAQPQLSARMVGPSASVNALLPPDPNVPGSGAAEGAARAPGATDPRAVKLTTLRAQITVSVPAGASRARAAVFANCPYLSADTPVTDPHYVGSIDFFGVLGSSGGHVGHRGGQSPGKLTVTFTLALDTTLSRLAGMGRATDGRLRLQLLAKPAPGGGSPPSITLEKVEVVAG